MKLTKFSQRPGQRQRSRSWDRGLLERERAPRESSLPRNELESETQWFLNQPKVLVTSHSIEHPIESDALKRKHYKRPVSGIAYLTIRTAKHHNLSITSHVTDLQPRIEEDVRDGKVAVVISVDGGPDLAVRNLANIMEYGRLWKTTNLQVLIVFDYGAKQSALNEIERIWSPVTKTMSGIHLHDKVVTSEKIVDGVKVKTWEKESPANQTKLSDEERDAKEAKVFNTAMEEAQTLISENAVYGGERVLCSIIKCFSSEESSDRKNYQKLYDFTKSKTIKAGQAAKNKDHVKDLKFISRHLTRQHNCLTFVLCKSSKCSHCKDITPAQCTKNLQSNGYRLPDPEMSTKHPGHYLTFMDLEEKYRYCELPRADMEQPSRRKKNFGRCRELGCREYVFMSAADETRHINLAHGGKRSGTPLLPPAKDRPKIGAATKPKPHNRKCQVCGVVYKSEHQLVKHKKATGHVARRGRKSKV